MLSEVNQLNEWGSEDIITTSSMLQKVNRDKLQIKGSYCGESYISYGDNHFTSKHKII